jgi:hypothetical protein
VLLKTPSVVDPTYKVEGLVGAVIIAVGTPPGEIPKFDTTLQVAPPSELIRS